MGKIQRRIYLLDHSSDWLEQFMVESRKWHELLNYNVQEIHHIGSTAIDNIKAKPINRHFDTSQKF